VLLNIKADITCFGEIIDSNSFVTHFFFHSNNQIYVIFPLQTSLVFIYEIISVSYQRYLIC